GELGRYLYYSRSALNFYHIPSVWYAAGFSVGPTASPGCSFSEADVADAYNSILAGIPMYASSGIIGVAPYRFLDSPAGAPAACPLTGALAFTAATATPQDTGISGPATLASVTPRTELDSADGSSSLTVVSISAASPAFPAPPDNVSFIADDNNAYLAKVENDRLNLYPLECQYGFRDSSGALRPDSSFAWFSSCKFYYTNNDSFTSEPPPALAEKGTQQPVMFSTNGRGSVCSVFGANKMLTRFGTAVQPVSLPADPAELTRINSLQCGACLSDAPMPQAFCNAQVPGSTVFPKGACTQFPQMDDAFQLAGLDPVFMRAIAVGESGLGNGMDSGPASPACQIAALSSKTGSGKDVATLQKYPSYAPDGTSICSSADIASSARQAGVDDSTEFAAGLGVMQCIKAPRKSYNPFDPYQSAECGDDQFGSRLSARRTLLNSARASNANLAAEISPAQVDWYAAWLAADGYYGMYLVNGTANFKSGDEDTAAYINRYPANYAGGFVQYMLDYYQNERNLNHPNWIPTYGLRVIRRYNNGISACSSGCAQTVCPNA
ncbi:MAG: hypothetical protein KGH63_04715, partial [Candidatus Micrarchaeota archaeon]|nr:hypothetical protein [Candidatus Micrarchaeota archaeon]